MKVHVKVFIKSEADLPDRTDNYIVGLKDEDGSARLLHFAPTGLSSTIIKLEWLRNVDYWLKEVELAELIEVPSENLIYEWAGYCAGNTTDDHDKRIVYQAALVLGAKWMREEILKRNR